MAANGGEKYVFVDPASLGINLSGMPPGFGLVSTQNSASANAATFGEFAGDESPVAAPAPKKSSLKKQSPVNSLIHSEEGLNLEVIPVIEREVGKEIYDIYPTILKKVLKRMVPSYFELTKAEQYYVFNKMMTRTIHVPIPAPELKEKMSKFEFNQFASNLFAQAIASLTNSNMNYVSKLNINGEQYNEIKHAKFETIKEKIHAYIKSRVDPASYEAIKGIINYKLDRWGPNTESDPTYANNKNRRTLHDEEYYGNLVGTKPIGKLGSPEFQTSELKYEGGRRRRKTCRRSSKK